MITMDILELLVQKGKIKKKDTEAVSKEAADSGLTLEEVLIKRGVSPEDILSAKGQSLDIPTRHVGKNEIPSKILDYIPQESAEHYKFVPIAVTDGVLEVGMVDPDNIDARDALNFISSKVGMPFKIFLISQDDFDSVVEQYKGLVGEVGKSLSELETELEKEKETATDESDKTDVLGLGGKGDGKKAEITEDAPVIKIVATILRYATDGNASDVHIEPERESVRVRFRVDGEMNTSLTLPIKIHQALVARIKVLTQSMKLDEKRKPQDGRFSARIENRRIDFRVSTFPTYFGEKVVMRILDQEKGVKKLEDIGMSKKNMELVRQAINRPYGIILISGPTGSGKTTTLYSMLNEIDREHQNVLSLEDPIEYNIEGMSQSQVQPEIGYTFASGLRTTLRQDPDVIMVGEIRDEETAQLAIQAALTGHLVLSTIHTNSATGVIPRLIDMKVDPYLIAPTLILAMAQRLTLGLAPGSGKAIPIEGSLKVMIDKQFEDLPKQFRDEIEFTKEVYEPTPTADSATGTRGRQAVMEMFPMDKDLESLLLKNSSEADISKLLRSKGMLTMKEDAIIKAMHKVIPWTEINAL